MRQGNDHGTQYRSVIYTCSDAQKRKAEASREVYRAKAGKGSITTEILFAPDLSYAEDHHQQYLAKNPGDYCGIGGAGISCPAGVDLEA